MLKTLDRHLVLFWNGKRTSFERFFQELLFISDRPITMLTSLRVDLIKEAFFVPQLSCQYQNMAEVQLFCIFYTSSESFSRRFIVTPLSSEGKQYVVMLRLSAPPVQHFIVKDFFATVQAQAER